jgi:hypothetical protein
MKTNEATINTILNINLLMIDSHLKGNPKRKRFYQSLLNWVISKEIK